MRAQVGVNNPNTFRHDECYCEAVDGVLRKYESSLRALFAVLATKPRLKREAAAMPPGAAKPEPLEPLIKFDSWRAFLRRLDLIGYDLAERNAALCFVWSRLCVPQPYTERGELRLVGLPFEGFLEALCRVAVLKALPTDEEITAGGYMHAGDMLVCLRDDDPPAYKALIRAHANPWGAWAVEGGCDSRRAGASSMC